MNTKITKTLKSTFATISTITLIVVGMLPALEPVIASADTDDVVVTQVVDSGISITTPDDVSMSRHLSLTANTATASTTWNVKTTNAAGYTLDVHASTDPAMNNATTSESFTDYTGASTSTPETWSVSNAYEFGFSVHGDDMTGGFGSDTDCIAGDADTPSTDLNWMGFNGTTDIEIATNANATTQSGTDTTVCFATEQNSVYAPSGTYTATITATAVTQ